MNPKIAKAEIQKRGAGRLAQAPVRVVAQLQALGSPFRGDDNVFLKWNILRCAQ